VVRIGPAVHASQAFSMAADALLLQRLLKAVNGIQNERWHSYSSFKCPLGSWTNDAGLL
jgi:hypothetical protein